MSPSANVLAIETLADVKNAMISFAEDAKNALTAVDMELRRTRDWLEREQLSYWKNQIKRRNEEVMQAKTDLFRRKLSQSGSDTVSVAEQKEALRIAKARLETAERKFALVKKMVPELERAIGEYHSHAQPLGDHLGASLDRSLAGLDARIRALEAYLATAVPTGPRDDGEVVLGAASAKTSEGQAATTAQEGEGASAEASAASTEDSGNGNGNGEEADDGAANGSPAGETNEALVSGTTP